MTHKEQLREKFISVLHSWDTTDLFPHEGIVRDLMAAVEEFYSKYLVLTIKLDEKQIADLNEEFMRPCNIEVWHSCGSCGAPLIHTQSQQYEGT